MVIAVIDFVFNAAFRASSAASIMVIFVLLAAFIFWKLDNKAREDDEKE